MKRIAGIVLYNPDVKRLKENIGAILPQVDELLLIENGSNSVDYLKQLEGITKIVVIQNNVSKGIAYALNQILGYAYYHRYDWALTLDQDSVVNDNILDVYEKYTNPSVGIIGCRIVDRNFNLDESWVDGRPCVEVGWIISSASYTNTKAWKEIGGFDTGMFIDWVDTEYCTNLKKHSYKVLQVFETSLLHELGENASIKTVYGRTVYVLNRPSFRYFFVFRNYVYLAKKHPDFYKTIPQCKTILLTALGILKYESHKLSNLWAMVKGVICGLFMPVSYDSISDQFFLCDAG